MNTRFAFACALLCLGLGASPLAANAQDTAPQTVQVLLNHTLIGKYAPFFVGIDKGYYRDVGLEVTVSPTSGSGFVISSLEGGKADYGVSDVGPAIQAMAKGSRVRGVFVFMNRSAVALASLKPYPDLASLRGSRIAASPADSARVALPIVLARNHLEDLPFEWVAADPNVYFSLLLDDQVDLASSSIDGDVPALRKIAEPRGKTVHYLSLYDWGYRIYGLWLLANQNKLEHDPDEVERFTQATRKAMLYAIEHPEEAAQIMVARNPVLNRDTILTQWSQSIVSMGDDPTENGQYGFATPDRLQETIDIVGQALRLETSALQPESVFSPAFTRPKTD